VTPVSAPDQRLAVSRCSETSLALGEHQEGTASTVTRWLLIEQRGPWGYDARRSNRMPPTVARHLRREARRLDVRLVLIRRPAPRGGPTIRGYSARTARGERSLWSFSVPSIEALADVEMAGLVDPETATGDIKVWRRRDDEPLLLVCTNGRRDPCCAERGRPVFAALEPLAPGRVWECSHIGGDRFAANVVWLPEGVYYGRVEPADAGRLVRATADRRVLLDRFRGRTDGPMPAQAAEAHVRRQLGLDRADDVLSVTSRPAADDGSVDVTLELADGRRAPITVHVDRASPPRRLTCHSERTVLPPAYRPVTMSVEP
jgi:hypothetical protein